MRQLANKITVSMGSMLLIVALSGCAVKRAGVQMQQSREAYRQCLQANSEDVSRCEAQRRIYLMDMQNYTQKEQALEQAVRALGTVQVNVHSQPANTSNVYGHPDLTNSNLPFLCKDAIERGNASDIEFFCR